MPFVMDLDQQRSRAHGLEPTRRLLAELNADPDLGRAIPFRQAAGDEIQGVLGHARDVIRVCLRCARTGQWWIGIGEGDVTLTAGDVHRSTGPGFVHARKALEAAKKQPWGIALRGEMSGAHELDRALALWYTVVSDRTDRGWEVAEQRDEGVATQEIAKTLGISEQAVTERLRTANWRLDHEGRLLIEALAGVRA